MLGKITTQVVFCATDEEAQAAAEAQIPIPVVWVDAAAVMAYTGHVYAQLRDQDDRAWYAIERVI